MEDNCGIYSITNVVNNKKLIGQSSDIKRRFTSHKWRLRNNRHENQYLQNAWNKYGSENFKFEIIVTCQVESLDMEEIKQIELFNTKQRDFGYNLQDGGDRHNHSTETIEKIRKKAIGRVFSDSTKLKLSKALSGRKRSEEVKKKISESQKGTKNHRFGKKMSDYNKRKLREVHLGSHHSEETKRELRELRLGDQNPFFGEKHSEETRQKMREGQAKYQARRKLESNRLAT